MRRSRRMASAVAIAYTHTHIYMCMTAHIHTLECIVYCILDVRIGSRTHNRVHTDTLRSGVSARRGKYISERGRCVQCVAQAPKPTMGRKFKLVSGKSIPNVYYACDVCRVHLCRSCFALYNHRKGGKPCESVVLRWFLLIYWLIILCILTFIDVYIHTNMLQCLYITYIVHFALWHQQIIQNGVYSHPHYCSKSTCIHCKYGSFR